MNEAVRKVLSDALPALKDPRIGFVTVTGVRTTKDLSQATVFVSVLGDEEEQARTLAGLQSAHGVLQAQVARELGTRRTPVLTFEYDPAIERGVRLTKIIDELAPPGGTMSTQTDMQAVAAALREQRPLRRHLPRGARRRRARLPARDGARPRASSARTS